MIRRPSSNVGQAVVVLRNIQKFRITDSYARALNFIHL